MNKVRASRSDSESNSPPYIMRLVRLVTRWVSLLSLLAAILLSAERAATGQTHVLITTLDPCLRIDPDSISITSRDNNRDSVAVDTCASSSTYRHWYSKRYDVHFRVNAFHLGYGAPDSVMIVHWQDIDTQFAALRDSFASIYNTWGPFCFQKVNPEDTSHSYETYKLIFDDYHLADGGVLDALNKIWTDGLVEITFNIPRGAPDGVIRELPVRGAWRLSGRALSINLEDILPENIRVDAVDIVGRRISNLPVSCDCTSVYAQLKIDLQFLPIGAYLLVLQGTNEHIFITLY
jgi:hypothetical protein